VSSCCSQDVDASGTTTPDLDPVTISRGDVWIPDYRFVCSYGLVTIIVSFLTPILKLNITDIHDLDVLPKVSYVIFSGIAFFVNFIVFGMFVNPVSYLLFGEFVQPDFVIVFAFVMFLALAADMIYCWKDGKSYERYKIANAILDMVKDTVFQIPIGVPVVLLGFCLMSFFDDPDDGIGIFLGGALTSLVAMIWTFGIVAILRLLNINLSTYICDIEFRSVASIKTSIPAEVTDQESHAELPVETKEIWADHPQPEPRSKPLDTNISRVENTLFDSSGTARTGEDAAHVDGESSGSDRLCHNIMAVCVAGACSLMLSMF